MVKRRKGRAKRNMQSRNKEEPESLVKSPHTMVFHRGGLCPTVKCLISDLRHMLEPFTASKLRIRRKNVIKDFTSIAGIFHVSHLWILSRSTANVYLRIAGLPAGPTLKFRIVRFSNAKDVHNFVPKSTAHSSLFTSPPLLITSSNDIPMTRASKMVTSVLRRSFPPFSVNEVKLKNIRRCVLFYRESEGCYKLRHYSIRCSPSKDGVSSAVRRLFNKKQLPDLSRCSDVSEFVYQPALSESEDEEKVELPQELDQIQTRGTQSAVKLKEIGPRIDLELSMIEDGVCEGNRIWWWKEASK